MIGRHNSDHHPAPELERLRADKEEALAKLADSEAEIARSVESEEGVGSTFSFTVAMEEVEGAKAMPSEAFPSTGVVAPVPETEKKL